MYPCFMICWLNFKILIHSLILKRGLKVLFIKLFEKQLIKVIYAKKSIQNKEKRYIYWFKVRQRQSFYETKMIILFEKDIFYSLPHGDP